ncbi:hypothetical protein D3C87_2037800 [compost metagenome]
MGFYSDALRSINFASSYPSGERPGGYQDLSADVGGFLNLNYMYKNRLTVFTRFQVLQSLVPITDMDIFGLLAWDGICIMKKCSKTNG